MVAGSLADDGKAQELAALVEHGLRSIDRHDDLVSHRSGRIRKSATTRSRVLSDVPVADPKPEIAVSKGSAMALKVRRLNRHNGSLHAHVLIWQGFGLCAEAESAHPLQQLSLSRGPIGREPDLTSWLVEIPNRYRERPASLFRNADDSHVKIGEKALAFLLRHGRCHGTLPSCHATFTRQDTFIRSPGPLAATASAESSGPAPWRSSD